MERIVALVGPTAVGKTAVSVELAQVLGAEILSCDSMQIYRDMPILTQAPSHAQRRQVPHYLVECVEPEEPFSVGQYHRLAIPTLHNIMSRGKSALIVGGTGLYVKALLEGLCDAPPANRRIREQLWEAWAHEGAPAMYSRLRAVDRPAASRIHPNDARRIVRALEVFAVSGRPLSDWQRDASVEGLDGQIRVIGLLRDRAELYKMIDLRVSRMIYEEGVVNEARHILRRPLSHTARQVHGLADLEGYLAGHATLKDTVAIWQQRVRRYAKRQLTWFRQTPGIEWVELFREERPWETAQRVLDLLRVSQAYPSRLGEAPALS